MEKIVKTMKLHLKIETFDPKLDSDLFEATKLRAGQEKIISNGVSIRLESYKLRETVLPTIAFDVLVSIGQNVVLPIAISILSNYLYDKLKRRKDNTLVINNKSIEIDAEQIKQLIINIANEEKDE